MQGLVGVDIDMRVLRDLVAMKLPAVRGSVPWHWPGSVPRRNYFRRHLAQIGNNTSHLFHPFQSHSRRRVIGHCRASLGAYGGAPHRTARQHGADLTRPLRRLRLQLSDHLGAVLPSDDGLSPILTRWLMCIFCNVPPRSPNHLLPRPCPAFPSTC